MPAVSELLIDEKGTVLLDSSSGSLLCPTLDQAAIDNLNALLQKLDWESIPSADGYFDWEMIALSTAKNHADVVLEIASPELQPLLEALDCVIQTCPDAPASLRFSGKGPIPGR